MKTIWFYTRWYWRLRHIKGHAPWPHIRSAWETERRIFFMSREFGFYHPLRPTTWSQRHEN